MDGFVVSKAQSGIQFFFRIPSQVLRQGKENDGKPKKKERQETGDDLNASSRSILSRTSNSPSTRRSQPNQSQSRAGAQSFMQKGGGDQTAYSPMNNMGSPKTGQNKNKKRVQWQDVPIEMQKRVEFVIECQTFDEDHFVMVKINNFIKYDQKRIEAGHERQKILVSIALD